MRSDVDKIPALISQHAGLCQGRWREAGMRSCERHMGVPAVTQLAAKWGVAMENPIFCISSFEVIIDKT